MRESRVTIKIDPVTFAESFKSIADSIVKRGYNGYDAFQFNVKNKLVINQVYFHLFGSKKFDGNLNKNLMIVGNHGSGKSTIMQAMVQVIAFNTRRRLAMHTLEELNEMVRKKGIEHYYKRPMVFDEIGREEKHIMDYGNKIFPSIHLMNIRYHNGALTYAVGNFNREDLREIYGMYMFEKINEMFEVIELNDNNWREKNVKS